MNNLVDISEMCVKNKKQIFDQLERTVASAEVFIDCDGLSMLSDLDLDLVRAKLKYSIACLKQELGMIHEIRG